jgi:hypothetical protein
MIVSATFFAFLWAVWPTDSQSTTGSQILESAEAAFQEGIKARGTPEESKYFQLAADHYEGLRRSGVENAALYRNHGNALLLAGDWPGAILAYRRGLRLNPSDHQMRANLAYARDQVIYSSADNFVRPPASLWPPWLPRLVPSVTFWVLVVFYSLAWIGLARSWTSPNEGRRWLSWLGLAVSVLFSAILILQLRDIRGDAEHPLVVIAEDKTYLHTGNNDLYPQAYETPLNRGVEARMLQARGTWLQIELTGGQIGWMPGEKAIVDLPAPLSHRG